MGKDKCPWCVAACLAAHGLGEGPGGAGDLDGAGEDGGGDEGDGWAVYDAPAVAGTGDGGGAARQAPAAGGKGEADPASGAAAGGCPGGEASSRSMIDEPGSEGAAAHRAD